MVRAFMCACLLGAVAAATALAGQPTMERVVIDDVGIHDDFLSDACGFDVWFDGSGHITFRLFSDAEGNPLRELNNYAIRSRYFSEFGSVNAVNVGPDRITYEADGSLTVFTTGNIESLTAPGVGRVYSDVGWTQLHITFPDVGDPIVEFVSAAGQHWGDSVEVICGLLAPA
ncbi:MAG TPA: hypothetical protein VFV53_06830 [Candidatus Limnocylindrales bacterium]|nr:hypothetical protein [Candidatus Limnocylindrales bacterium]